MDCREARRLLDQGVIPGSTSAERATLGFHLAGCADCRGYRAALQERLLADLLSNQPRPAPRVPVSTTPAASRPRRRLSPSQVLRYATFGLLTAFVLSAVIVLGQATLSIYHIHQSVQAMTIPSPTLPGAAPTDTPTTEPAPPTPSLGSQPQLAVAALPSATAPRPSATPQLLTPTPQAPPAGGPVNILLLGSDRRPDESEPSRTDAVIIARLDPERHRVALLSLPRDLIVEVPGYGETRINAANVWGETYGAPGGGVALARKTVEHLLGIPIDYVVYIDFQGFIGAIDAAGGVTVDVPTELYDPQFPTMDYGYTVAHFLPGPQQMDGATALMYSRIRHSDSDFARMRRQQQVLAGVLASLRDQNIFESLKRIDAVTAALRDYVRTDIPEERMLGLAWALRGTTPDQIEHYLLDENMITFGVGSDRWAEVAVSGAIDELVAKLIGQTTP
jgi:polyisoprenyl-teichoic acid--peptidoglycan teichoic acid transferase